MNILAKLTRLLMLARVDAIPSETFPAPFSDYAVPLLVDENGALWTHDIAAGGGSITPSETNRFSIFSTPAVATQATATTAAAGAGRRNVLSSLSVTIDAPGGEALQTVVVRDGASGVGTILWSQFIGATPAGESRQLHYPFPDGIPGSVNTSMTVELTAAPGAGNRNSVAGTGYLTPGV